ncbi:MAG TPA: pinensin family lanthipeptide [Longimicrobium sp.]|nr:pinensin family lanthipeptide [Longimicrobium sp.]
MRKLKLQLDSLEVESFSTDEVKEEIGTVHAHVSLACTNAPNGTTCNGNATCDGAYTCDGEYTCNYKSCDGVCGTYYCSDSSPVISAKYVDGACI